MTLLVAAGLLCAGLVAFFYYGAKPARYRHLTPQRLGTLAGAVLERGRAGAVLFVEERGGRRFVQLTKYVASAARSGIQCDFPLAPWSEEFYPRVPECVARLGLRARQTETGRGDTRGFITVDFGSDVSNAVAFVTCVVEDVFGLNLADQCEAYMQGVSVHASGAVAQKRA